MSKFVEDWLALFEDKGKVWIHPDSIEGRNAVASLFSCDNKYHVTSIVHGHYESGSFDTLEEAIEFGEHWFEELYKRVVADKAYVYGTENGGLNITSVGNGISLTREEAVEFIRTCQERMKR